MTARLARCLVVLALPAALACVATPGPAVAAAPAGTTVVTQARSGDVVTIARGRTLELRLTACLASCGFRYETVRRPDPSVLRFRSSRVETPEQPQDGPPVVGGSSTKVVRYRATGRGTTRLALRLVGPDGTVDQRFRLTVRVR
ncbi:hypothetical protein GKE82_02670 [Conexibacter sp. W3-3-2]|uniref:protease inhibitor I42 family protein n=1 Tax=Conexibacter sp. W3-3-2 TaxID=2675227 RepID=UPI0012B92B40|nr:protease inhibitor I42 family protein [Conexibacter sp. W3-3-2]MTD43236.1 hypothetical protein [Conexibacter sp. W3-3-2]